MSRDFEVDKPVRDKRSLSAEDYEKWTPEMRAIFDRINNTLSSKTYEEKQAAREAWDREKRDRERRQHLDAQRRLDAEREQRRKERHEMRMAYVKRMMGENRLPVRVEPGKRITREWFDDTVFVPDLSYGDCELLGVNAVLNGYSLYMDIKANKRRVSNPREFVLYHARRVQNGEKVTWEHRHVLEREGRMHQSLSVEDGLRFLDTQMGDEEAEKIGDEEELLTQLPAPRQVDPGVRKAAMEKQAERIRQRHVKTEDGNAAEYRDAVKNGRPGPLLPSGPTWMVQREPGCDDD